MKTSGQIAGIEPSQKGFLRRFLQLLFHQVELVQVEYCTEEVLHRLSQGLSRGRIVSHVWVTLDASVFVLERFYQFGRENQGR